MEEPKGGTGFPPRKWPALLGNDFGDNDGLKEGFYILARAGIGWGYPYSFKSWSRSRVYWDSYLPAHVSSGFSPKSGLKVWYHYHRHLSRIVLPIFSISIRQDNPKKKELSLKKTSLPLYNYKATRYVVFLCFIQLPKNTSHFSIQKNPLGRALRQHQMCSLAFPGANATVQLLTSTIVKTATARGGL